MEKEIAEIKQRLATVEQKINNQCEKCEYVTKDFHIKLKETNEILENMRTLAITMTTLTEQVKHMNSDIGTIKTQIEEVSKKPAAKWDKLTTTIITAIVSGIIALAISLIFK